MSVLAKYMRCLKVFARMVRIEHTLFSLPFMLIGLVVARCVEPKAYILSFMALFSLRSFSIIMNDLMDLDVDLLNPRTCRRLLTSSLVKIQYAVASILFFAVLYLVSVLLINPKLLLLATPPLILAASYPLAKRVHPLPHLHLGSILGLAVVDGYVVGAYYQGISSLTVLLEKAPWLIALGVTLWVAGFDIVYSIQDYEFDSKYGLGSIPVWLGVTKAIRASMILEICALISWSLGAMMYSGFYAMLSSLAASAIPLYALIMLSRKRWDVMKVFKSNLVVGLIALPGYILDWWC